MSVSRCFRRGWFPLIFALGSLLLIAALQATTNPGNWILWGYHLDDQYDLGLAAFLDDAAAHAGSGPVNLLIVPDNAASAAAQRLFLETACRARLSYGRDCTVAIAPIYLRETARDPQYLSLFEAKIDGVFLHTNDTESVIAALGGTPFGAAIELAQARQGVVVSGPAAALSNPYIAANRLAPDWLNALDFGAAILGGRLPPSFALTFAPRGVLMADDPFNVVKFPLLLGAMTAPPASSLDPTPNLVIGFPNGSVARLTTAGRLTSLSPSTSVLILDGDTYHAIQGVQYAPPNNVVSLRNLVVHLLPAQGEFDLASRQVDALPLPPQQTRSFKRLQPPSGAGELLLTGGLAEWQPTHPLMTTYLNRIGGQQAHLLLLTLGFGEAQAAAATQPDLSGLGVAAVATLNPTTLPELLIPPETTGVLLVVGDPAAVSPEIFARLRTLWLDGLPIMTDARGAALPWLDGVQVVPDTWSVGWEPFFRAAFDNPDLLTLSLAPESGLLILPSGATALGRAPVISLDLRAAAFPGESPSLLAFRGGLLDVFAPGDRLQPAVADSAAAPIVAATPFLSPTPSATPLPSATPTVTVTPTATSTITPAPTIITGKGQGNARPTRTARPSATPVISPPPPDPDMTNLMLAFAGLAVAVVLVGVWINRGRGL
jgi:hypothetical protein